MRDKLGRLGERQVVLEAFSSGCDPFNGASTALASPARTPWKPDLPSPTVANPRMTAFVSPRQRTNPELTRCFRPG